MKTLRTLQALEIELTVGGRKPDPELTDHPQPDPYTEPQRYFPPEPIPVVPPYEELGVSY
jgi:hypothetical protein